MYGTPVPKAPINEDYEAKAGERQVHPPSWQPSDAELDPNPAPPPVQLLTKQDLGGSP